MAETQDPERAEPPGVAQLQELVQALETPKPEFEVQLQGQQREHYFLPDRQVSQPPETN
jgi:hypothetical protein